MLSFARFLVRSAMPQAARLGLRHIVVLAVLLWCWPFLAVAQDASIVGTVTDRSGSVVPNLQITITVEADPVRVQTDSGEQSNVITGQQISQIAVSGRSIYQLAALTPGASSQIGAGGMSAGVVNTSAGGDSNVEFNGMRQNHNIYLLDGGEDDDRGGAGGMSIAPSSDAIAEFRALTSNYSADYGLSSGGTMTMVLKSGSSTLHTSAWEFNRNDALDARNFFNPAPQPVAELRLNTFGFNVGGPVTLATRECFSSGGRSTSDTPEVGKLPRSHWTPVRAGFS
jgi:hypothetical protein